MDGAQQNEANEADGRSNLLDRQDATLQRAILARQDDEGIFVGNGLAERIAAADLPDGEGPSPCQQGVGIDDPVDGANFDVFAYLPPAPGYGATDMVQLPDSRILLLVRTVDPWGGIPPFDTKIAIGPVPKLGDGEVWKPQISLNLGDVVPRENYEGIAARLMADGRVAVWLISDDNLSVMQRTLLVKMIFDPASVPDKAKGARK